MLLQQLPPAAPRARRAGVARAGARVPAPPPPPRRAAAAAAAAAVAAPPRRRGRDMRRAATPPASNHDSVMSENGASASASPPSLPLPPLPPVPEPRHTLLGVEADLVAIVLVYFVQGALGLSRLAVSFFLKDELHLDPAQMARPSVRELCAHWGSVPDARVVLCCAAPPGAADGRLRRAVAGQAAVGLPVGRRRVSRRAALACHVRGSDTCRQRHAVRAVPLFGYRRRSYLVLCGGLGAAGWSALAAPGLVHTPGGALAALLATSLATAASDVVVDSLVVERARGESAAAAGGLQSLCWGAASVGGVCSAYFSGSLVQSWGPRAVFGLTAAFPLLTAAVAPLVRDAPAVTPGGGSGIGLASVKAQAARLWSAARTRAIWLPAAFLFVWQASPSPDAALFYFTTSQLGFTPEFLGRARLAGALASLAGVALYNSRLKAVPIRSIFRVTALLGAGLGLTQLILVTGLNRTYGISDQLFALSDTVVLTVLGQVAFMPTLVLAARICPEGVEATLFAALMSVFNAAGVASGAMGAALTSALHVGTGGAEAGAADFENLPLLIVLCNLLGLLPLPFLYLLDEVPGLADAEDGKESGGGSGDVELLEREGGSGAGLPGAGGAAAPPPSGDDGHKSD
jgi:folate/biopterin transporter